MCMVWVGKSSAIMVLVLLSSFVPPSIAYYILCSMYSYIVVVYTEYIVLVCRDELLCLGDPSFRDTILMIISTK